MCEFCNFKTTEIEAPSGVIIFSRRESIIADSTRVYMWKMNDRSVLKIYNDMNSNQVDIVYCPFCGRKL